MWKQISCAFLAIGLCGCAQSPGDDASPTTGQGDYLPVTKIKPEYPAGARTEGIEGYVIVEYTVTESGNVEGALVTHSEPEGVFDQAALEAARQFEYEPRMVDGKTVRVPGVRNRFQFSLAQ